MVDLIKIEVPDPGAMLVNMAYAIAKGKRVIAIAVDLHSKRGNVGGYWGSGDNGPGVEIYPSKESLHLDETKPRDSRTTIYFPEFKGWDVWAAEISKYTLAVCLIKRD